jgi:hypothetical protein
VTSLRHAFKEWAAICRALAQGQQAIILRKGGIAEQTGEFTPEHSRFWLYPTYLHEKPDALVPEAEPLLRQAEADRPPAGVVRLSHWAEVAGIYHLHEVASALKLADLHLWSPQTVQARFFYRAPGLYVLPVRVWRAPEPIELPETTAYAGCRTWVDLGRDLATDGSTPVLSDAAFTELLRTLDAILQPTAWA